MHVNRKFFELVVGHGFHIAMLNDHGWIWLDMAAVWWIGEAWCGIYKPRIGFFWTSII